MIFILLRVMFDELFIISIKLDLMNSKNITKCQLIWSELS